MVFLVWLPPLSAQALSLAEVTARGAKPLSVDEARELVTGAKTTATGATGAQRIWTNAADGTFVASRSTGPAQRRTARGLWSVNARGAYCLGFDWGGADTESSCRQLYRVDGASHAYGVGAPPDARSGQYSVSK
jgi:hypothetical protein